MTSFSLIVPVYNAAKTLPRLLESISAQSFRDFEVIFTDDACSDGSPALLEAFRRYSGLQCTILRNESNAGAAASRNRALDAARGEYLVFADADDSMDPGMLAKAAAAIASGHPDIVGWDWTLRGAKGSRYIHQADYGNPGEALSSLTGGKMRWNLWLFAVRRSLITSKHIRFIDGADMGEDMQFMLRAFMLAGSTMQLHESLYSYNAVNESSISRQFTPERRAQIERNLAAAQTEFEASAYKESMPDAMDRLKLYLKRPLLISPRKEDYLNWFSWFPETNALARRGSGEALHTEMLQKMGARQLWPLVRLYYVLVHKMVYGLIYR